ncbi:MAG: low molecular weight protein arginine phosphatase [Bacillota bacterium]|nr:low molecular weight protein arginine phosphatase [Bacillota bacterium]
MILFVCTGNTCRSPMAECIYKAITGKEAQSAGIAANPGMAASPNAVAVMKEKGYDLGHISRQVNNDMLDEADTVITLTVNHANLLKKAAPEFSEKIISLYEWAGKKGDVLDPYGGDINIYRACAEEIEELINEGQKIHG